MSVNFKNALVWSSYQELELYEIMPILTILSLLTDIVEKQFYNNYHLYRQKISIPD